MPLNQESIGMFLLGIYCAFGIEGFGGCAVAESCLGFDEN